MHWEFIEKRMIREKESGYVIQLLSGTWISPKEVKPITTRQTHYLKQAELLRQGLAFAQQQMLQEQEA